MKLKSLSLAALVATVTVSCTPEPVPTSPNYFVSIEGSQSFGVDEGIPLQSLGTHQGKVILHTWDIYGANATIRTIDGITLEEINQWPIPPFGPLGFEMYDFDDYQLLVGTDKVTQYNVNSNSSDWSINLTPIRSAKKMNNKLYLRVIPSSSQSLILEVDPASGTIDTTWAKQQNATELIDFHIDGDTLFYTWNDEITDNQWFIKESLSSGTPYWAKSILSSASTSFLELKISAHGDVITLHNRFDLLAYQKQDGSKLWEQGYWNQQLATGSIIISYDDQLIIKPNNGLIHYRNLYTGALTKEIIGMGQRGSNTQYALVDNILYYTGEEGGNSVLYKLDIPSKSFDEVALHNLGVNRAESFSVIYDPLTERLFTHGVFDLYALKVRP